jgi:hypothetical protein
MGEQIESARDPALMTSFGLSLALANKTYMTNHHPDSGNFRFESVLSVGPTSIDAYRALRLRGLREHPESFGETPQSFEAKSNEQILERIEAQMRLGGFILAANSCTGELIGTVGLAINDAEKSPQRFELRQRPRIVLLGESAGALSFITQ